MNDGVWYKCPRHGCVRKFETIDEARRHRRTDHDDQPTPVPDGGRPVNRGRRSHSSIDWPLTVNGHALVKTHSAGITSQRLTCTDCGASSLYSTHDIGVDTTLDDLVRVLAPRLPETCSEVLPQTEASHE